MKHPTLFANATDTQNALVLEEPTQEQWHAAKQQLESRCTKQELQKYAEALIPWLSQYPAIKRATRNGRVLAATEVDAMLKTNASKSTIAQGLSLILGSRQNLQLYIDAMSTELRELWRTLLFNIFLTHTEAKLILKTSDNLFKEQRSYYYGNDTAWNKCEYGFFTTANFRSPEKTKYGYREYESFIALNKGIRDMFMPLFFSEASDSDSGLNELPAGEWRTVNFEAESMTHYQLLEGLLAQDALPVKKKGIGITDMKRVQKKIALAEFFPGDENEYRQNLRAFGYMQLLALNDYYFVKKKDNKIIPYEQVVRTLIDNFAKLDYFVAGILYPHIKGLTKQMTEYGRETKLCLNMLSCLREEPERWLSIRDIYLKICYLDSQENTSRYVALVFYPNDEQYTTEMINQYSNRIIAANSYAMQFGYTGLQMFAFQLASIGLAEVALNEQPLANLSPCSALEYVRLTPLGRYALGVTNDYEAPELEHVAYFELDPDRLIIRSLVDPNPYAQLLKDSSTPISRNRFETSALSFLANCHKREDVEQKISIFRRFIANELPPLWEQFFQQLLQHCHPLKEDRTGYKRYILSADNRDLIQLVTTDPVLRQIVVRAEGYRIMVKNDDLKKFETQLKKHGYLL